MTQKTTETTFRLVMNVSQSANSTRKIGFGSFDDRSEIDFFARSAEIIRLIPFFIQGSLRQTGHIQTRSFRFSVALGAMGIDFSFHLSMIKLVLARPGSSGSVHVWMLD